MERYSTWRAIPTRNWAFRGAQARTKSRRRSESSPRNSILTRTPAIRLPTSGSSGSPPPLTCWGTRTSGRNSTGARSTRTGVSNSAVSAAAPAVREAVRVEIRSARAVPGSRASRTSTWMNCSAACSAAARGRVVPGPGALRGRARTSRRRWKSVWKTRSRARRGASSFRTGGCWMWRSRREPATAR